MNRRGHLSHKVPNVKLRPAPAPSASSSRKRKDRESTPEMWRQQYHGEDEAEMPISGNSKPWKGIVVTFTGVDEKPHLTQLVKELGGEVENALTVTVTHVVAKDYGSAKYNYAIENRIPVMTPSWINDAYGQWLEGFDVDIEQEDEDHRLQPFRDLKISISGIDNKRRKQVIHYISSSGGTYSKDLDRSCTHLVSAKPTSDPKSSEKVKWALKEMATRESAKKKGKKVEDMKIVYEEWIWDCVGYRGRFKEEDYDAKKPRPKGKVKPEEVLDGSIFRQQGVKDEGTKEEEKPAVIKRRRKEALDNLVGDIISTTVKTESRLNEDDVSNPDNHANAEGGPSRIAPGAKHDLPHQPIPVIQTRADGRREPERKPSLLHRPRNAAFELPTPTSEPRTTASFPPTAPAQSSCAPNAPPPRVETPETQPLPAAERKMNQDDAEMDDTKPDMMFYDGLRFSHIIDEECVGLENALVAHGGTFVPNEERLAGTEVDYVVVRLHKRPSTVEGVKTPEAVTECWVEACCFEHRMISPDDHIVFRPLAAPMPIPGATKLMVHLSGFTTGETVYLRRLLRAVGGVLSEKMNRQTTHLISAVSDSPKARKAPEWGIYLVKQTWLLTSGKTGKIEPETEHRFDAPPPVAAVPHNRRLDLANGSMANMSVVLDIGEPTYERGKVAPPASNSNQFLPPTSQRSAPLSPSRMLKLTPTHVDDKDGGNYIGESRNNAGSPVPDPSNVLSPPKRGTTRLLNQAEDGRVGRTISAPPNAESMKKQENSAPLNPLRGSSTGGQVGQMEGPMGKKDMTHVLRQLAEQGEPPSSKPRAQRRPRSSTNKGRASSARARTSSVSVSPQKRASPDVFDAAANTSPHPETMGQVNEETIRVSYIDSDAEKARKKLLDAVRKSDRKAEVSPKKKAQSQGRRESPRTRG